MILGIVCMLATPQVVHGLSIDITSQGTVTVYSGAVLGDEIETEKMLPRNAQVRKEEAREEEKLRVKRQVIKTIPAQSKEKIRLKDGEESIEVEVERPEETRIEKKRVIEKFKDTRVEASFPAQLKPKKDETEIESDSLSDRVRRRNEHVELRAAKTATGKAEFELQSRDISAKSRGAQFLLDPETNQIILTTPSGNQHVLRHLPDQAVDNMVERGFLEEGEVPELELTELTNGEVGYKARITKRKKLFGLFNREVAAEIIMSDQTQTVIEQETDTSLGTSILNWLSTE